MKQPYGWRSKGYRFIFGPGNFEMPSADALAADRLGPLTPFYLEPEYPGQEPFGCVCPEVGIFLFYRNSFNEVPGLVYAYDAVNPA